MPGKRIVIADDTAIMRAQLRLIFERRGDTVLEEVDNGQDACRAYADLRPDLMTMDINMPEMTGMEAVRKLRERFDVGNIVMISTENERGRLMQAFQLGIKFYILKPFEENKVLSVAGRILGVSPVAEKPLRSLLPRTEPDAGIIRRPVVNEGRAAASGPQRRVVSESLAGAVVAEDIRNSQGKLLLKAGQAITPTMIQILIKYRVRHVTVQ